MALCGGSLYAFSRFEVQIMSHCSLSAQHLDVIYMQLARQVLVWASFLALYMISVVLLEHASMVPFSQQPETFAWL